MRSCKRINRDSRGRLLDLNQLCGYLNMGRNRADEFGEHCGAKRKLGRSVRYDLKVIDAALDKMEQSEGSALREADHAKNP